MNFDTAGQYINFIRPERAPETWVFGAVWSVLYLIIAIVMIALVVQMIQKKLPWVLLIPFGINLIFNLLYTPIQFGLMNMELAFVDIILVLFTIVWCMIVVRKYRKWMSLAYIPYLVWVCIATVLHVQIMVLNR